MINAWLVAPELLGEIEHAARVTPTAEQLEAFARGAEAPALRVEGGTAHVSVIGVLTQRQSMLTAIMGGTSYASISNQLSSAAADPSVRHVQMHVDSPGGQVSGLFELLAQLENFPKPINVKASLAASAAYAIAAAAGPIEAIGPASVFGSIGVATRIQIDRSVRDIASTDAPNKRPDVSTPEGVAAVRAELDQLHELFADAIARGRKTTAKKVNSDFGRGGTLLAAAAKDKNMIDSISGYKSDSRSSGAAAQLGPQQQAAQQLEQRIGTAATRGDDETQLSFGKRILAGVEPEKPAAQTRSLADQIADFICSGKAVDPSAAPKPADEAPADAVARLVVASMKQGDV